MHYLSAANGHMVIHSENGDIRVHRKLSAVQSDLFPQFMAIHRSYCINTAFLRSVRQFEAELTDGTVDGKSVGAVGEYLFTHVTDNHTISAAFEKIATTGEAETTAAPISIMPKAIAETVEAAPPPLPRQHRAPRPLKSPRRAQPKAQLRKTRRLSPQPKPRHKSKTARAGSG